ncbi:MAG TPA: hypothetical protein VLJ68_12630 [Chitinophagaceae bacterium]|nr:hypothetical protein [Chitinophagaceae bacterium]
MKKILLLVAIYSLIFHQSKKNGKQILPGIQETMRKEISAPSGAGARSTAVNNYFEKGISLESRQNAGPAFVHWTGRR